MFEFDCGGRGGEMEDDSRGFGVREDSRNERNEEDDNGDDGSEDDGMGDDFIAHSYSKLLRSLIIDWSMSGKSA